MQLAEASEHLETVQVDRIDRTELLKLEARAREAENKNDSERSSRQRLETQLDKLKEQNALLEQVYS